MLIDFNNVSVALYSVLSIILVASKKYIYSILLCIFTFFIFIQSLVNDKKLGQYTVIIPYILYILILSISVVIIRNSKHDDNNDNLSYLFLFLSIIYNLYKKYNPTLEFFTYKSSNYISPILFTVFLFNVGIIPDNQEVISVEYNKIKSKFINF